MESIKLIKNILISFFLLVIIVGGDKARTDRIIANAKDDITIVPTATPTPQATTKPTATPVVVISELNQKITVKVSHYWPDLGGVNCLTFKNGKCISKMANGKPWEDHVNKAIACPKELKLGTRIKVLGKIWTCYDRGGMIVKTESGAYWIDMLTEKAIVPYGTEIQAEIVK